MEVARCLLPVVSVILLHQGGVWPEHQLDLTCAAVVDRVAGAVLRSVVHVQSTVVARLGALDTRPRLLQGRRRGAIRMAPGAAGRWATMFSQRVKCLNSESLCLEVAI